MQKSLYSFILQHSKAAQIRLIALSLLILPIIYVSLELPKQIINVLNGHAMVDAILGYPLTQTSYLLILSSFFLLAVLVNGGMKYYINVYRGILGEKLLRRLRFDLYERVLRFPIPHFKRVSASEIVPMITAETEPLAEFIGESYTLPVFQGGMLLTYLFFIFQQDLFLGLASISLYPFQMVVIPKLQSKVNSLSKQRVKMARNLSGKIGQSIAGVVEIHANDTSYYERAIVSEKLGAIYKIREAIYRRKFFIKFLNNFIAQLTPFFFYAVGGYFVIKGDLSIGALVAVLVAYKDLAGPWKELLKYYQRKEDIKTKYNQIIEQFNLPNLLHKDILNDDGKKIALEHCTIQLSRASYSDDGSIKNVDGVSFKQNSGEHFALVGLGNSGKDELSHLIANLILPNSGQITLGHKKLASLPEALTGSCIAYLPPNCFLSGGSIKDNLLYVLKHKAKIIENQDNKTQHEDRLLALESGGSKYQLNDQWLDFSATGINNDKDLKDRIHHLLNLVELKDEIYQFGLLSPLQASSPAMDQSAFINRIMQARTAIRDKLSLPEFAKLIEPFDQDSYNSNMSAGENLLFGTLYDDSIDPEQMAKNPFIKNIMDDTGLSLDFVQAGIKVTEIMVDLFSDVEPGSDIFEQFSFISSEDLPEFKQLLAQIKETGFASISEENQNRLISLPFKLTVSRHRFGLIDSDIQQRILIARKRIREEAKDKQINIDFFEVENFNYQSSIQDNILFGKLAYGQANAQVKLNKLISDVVDELKLKEDILDLGLEYDVGLSASRLSSSQRQKLGLVRSLLKRPELLIVNESLANLDSASERRIIQNVRQEMHQRSVIWVLSNTKLAQSFDRVLLMDRGKLLANEPYQTLKAENSHFQSLIDD